MWKWQQDSCSLYLSSLYLYTKTTVRETPSGHKNYCLRQPLLSHKQPINKQCCVSFSVHHIVCEFTSRLFGFQPAHVSPLFLATSGSAALRWSLSGLFHIGSLQWTVTDFKAMLWQNKCWLMMYVGNEGSGEQHPIDSLAKWEKGDVEFSIA